MLHIGLAAKVAPQAALVKRSRPDCVEIHDNDTEVFAQKLHLARLPLRWGQPLRLATPRKGRRPSRHKHRSGLLALLPPDQETDLRRQPLPLKGQGRRGRHR